MACSGCNSEHPSSTFRGSSAGAFDPTRTCIARTRSYCFRDHGWNTLVGHIQQWVSNLELAGSLYRGFRNLRCINRIFSAALADRRRFSDFLIFMSTLMNRRYRQALGGVIAGLFTGLIFAAINAMFSDGPFHPILIISGFVVMSALIGFLVPDRATDIFLLMMLSALTSCV